MKPKTAWREWKKSYAPSWHCIVGRYYGWWLELPMMLLVTLLFPIVFALTVAFMKEPEYVSKTP